MKVQVKQLMTAGVKACDPSDSLAAAAIRMWDGDCGILPVVDGGRVVGLITDRDICMALALTEARAGERAVSDVMSGAVYSCSPEDEVIEALGKMGRHKVRRLVVLEGERLAGMLSMNDIVSCLGEHEALRPAILLALERIGAHRTLPTATVAA